MLEVLAERQESQEKLIRDSLTKLLNQESTQLTGKVQAGSWSKKAQELPH